MTATAAGDLDDLTARQHQATQDTRQSAADVAAAECAIGDAMAAGEQPTEAQLDTLADADARARVAKLHEDGLLRRRRTITGGRHPDDLDALTIAMRCIRGHRLASGRTVNAGDRVILTADECVSLTRIGVLELAEAVPPWWPRSLPSNLGAVNATLAGTRR